MLKDFAEIGPAREMLEKIHAGGDLEMRFSCVVLSSFAMSVSLALSATLAAAEGLVEVRDAVWTNSVIDKQPTKPFNPTCPLVLWTRVVGKTSALEILRSQKKLPIRHRWVRYVGTAQDYSDVKVPMDEIPLSVGSPETLEELQLELSANHEFDWRTWSEKENADAGPWRVEVLYNDGTPVRCGPSGNACAYHVRIKRSSR